MLMKVVNIHSFDLEIKRLNILLNNLDVGLACSFRFAYYDIKK